MKTSPSALTALLLADAMHIQTARAELQTQPGAGRVGRPYAFSSISSATTRRNRQRQVIESTPGSRPIPYPAEPAVFNGGTAELSPPSREILVRTGEFNRLRRCVNAECRIYFAPSAAASLR